MSAGKSPTPSGTSAPKATPSAGGSRIPSPRATSQTSRSPRSPSARSPQSARSPAAGSATASGHVSPTPSQAPSAPPPPPEPPEPPKSICPACSDPDVSPSGLNRSLAAKADILNTEYLYYSATLRELAPRLRNNQDRILLIPWIRKLFRPEYHSSRFREKRNKYLLYLVVTIMNDETFGIFRLPPPAGALQTIESLEPEEAFPPMEWERDSLWRETLLALPEEMRQMECAAHQGMLNCAQDRLDDSYLDEEFAFLLYLARPYVALLRTGDDRTTIANWLQKLCTIQAQSCTSMKRMRNEYIMVLVGYISELRVVGPFIDDPQFELLPPLADLAKMMSANVPGTIDPASAEISAFLAKQPMPNEGAFCYVAVTGDVLNTSLDELD